LHQVIFPNCHCKNEEIKLEKHGNKGFKGKIKQESENMLVACRAKYIFGKEETKVVIYV
jgi:hypothetical protein